MSALVETIPLEIDAHGRYRVSGTRILLEVVLNAYRQGKSAEQIVEDFPRLTSATVYLVLGYCLSHPDEVAAYLARIDHEDAELLAAHPEWQPVGLRAKLEARRAKV